MVINYKKTQKTVLRVNPRVPLCELLPAICEKCEFDTETTVLLRDITSSAPLDLSGSLNDYAIREVYAKDTQGKFSFSQIMLLILHLRICYSSHLRHVSFLFLLRIIGSVFLSSKSLSLLSVCRTSCFSCVPKLTSPCRYLVTANCIMTLKDQSYYSLNTNSDLFLCVLGLVTPGKDKIQKEKENKGLFSKFRKSKKKSDQVTVGKQNFYLCALMCLFGNDSNL